MRHCFINTITKYFSEKNKNDGVIFEPHIIGRILFIPIIVLGLVFGFISLFGGIAYISQTGKGFSYIFIACVFLYLISFSLGKEIFGTYIKITDTEVIKWRSFKNTEKIKISEIESMKMLNGLDIRQKRGILTLQINGKEKSLEINAIIFGNKNIKKIQELIKNKNPFI